ncbi:MAG: serine O-acetyltransferase [Acidimicrobiales bacterium]
MSRLDWVRAVLVAPLGWIYAVTDQQQVIDADVDRWAEILWVTDRKRLLHRLLFAFPEFRGIYYHRLRSGSPAGALLGRLAEPIWKTVSGLDLRGTAIGPGLFISHGQGTILSAERIGANVWVHQGVTVGWDYRGDRRPMIGSGVFIGAGAKILGAVTVGDDARIGANAVVVRDVPAGATAAGVPATIREPGPARNPDF